MHFTRCLRSSAPSYTFTRHDGKKCSSIFRKSHHDISRGLLFCEINRREDIAFCLVDVSCKPSLAIDFTTFLSVVLVVPFHLDWYSKRQTKWGVMEERKRGQNTQWIRCIQLVSISPDNNATFTHKVQHNPCLRNLHSNTSYLVIHRNQQGIYKLGGDEVEVAVELSILCFKWNFRCFFMFYWFSFIKFNLLLIVSV